MKIINIRAIVLVFSLFVFILFFQSCGDDGGNPTATGEITVSRTEINFGSVEIGQSLTVDLTISSSKSSDYSVDISMSGIDSSNFQVVPSGEVSIASNSTVTVRIKFVPTFPGDYSALLEIGDFLIPISANAWTSSSLAVAPLELDFGTVRTGTRTEKIIKVINLSFLPVEVNLSFLSNQDDSFRILSDKKLNLSPDESADILVEFYPASDNDYTASVRVDSFAVVNIMAKATSEITLDLSPGSVDFGEIVSGSIVYRTIRIENKSEIEAFINPVLRGSDKDYFELYYLPESPMIPGKIDSLKVKFKPVSEKDYQAEIKLTSSDDYIISLTGSAEIAVDIEFSPGIIDFGDLQIGADGRLKLSIKNISDNSLDYTAKFKTGADSSLFIDANAEASIDPGETKVINLRFTPRSYGNIKDSLIIQTSNNKDYSIPVKGFADAVQDLTLEANRVFSAPLIDGIGNDDEWNETEEMFLSMTQVEGSSGDMRTIKGYIKSIYDDEYIYFLVRIEDDTRNDEPNKLIFKGGDASKAENWRMETGGQDGISLVFPVSDVVFGDNDDVFDEIGCRTACHTPKSLNNFESGFYPTEGTLDIWYWKAATTNPQGYADDYFASGFDGIYPDRRSGDNGNTFAEANRGENSFIPLKVPSGNNNGLDKNKYLWTSTSTDFSPTNNPLSGTSWNKGDYVPGWKLRVQDQPGSGRGDVEARGRHVDGYWVVEFSRKLKTGDTAEDVVFVPGSEIPFSLAFFENTRKYSYFEYTNLDTSPRPGHFSPYPYSIILYLK